LKTRVEQLIGSPTLVIALLAVLFINTAVL
jgi:hypothetical protein